MERVVEPPLHAWFSDIQSLGGRVPGRNKRLSISNGAIAVSATWCVDEIGGSRRIMGVVEWAILC